MPGASVEQAYAAFFVWHAEALAAHPPAEEAGVITRANGTLGLFLRSIAELCNGSTYDSDSYCLGSNPSSPARLHGQAVKTSPSQGEIRGSIPLGATRAKADLSD